MRRWKIIFSSCLVLLLTTLSLAWAAQEYKTQVKLSGTKLSVQHLVQGKDKIKESAVLLNKNNKIVARWKPRTTNKWYKDYQDGWKYFRYIPYTMDMQKLPAGTYRFVTTTTLANKQYDRQFITRHKQNSDVLAAFEKNLRAYFTDGTARREGLPSVGWFADKACLSPGYFGDLVKRETGLSAQQYIQQKIVALAKQQILDESLSISQVADALGFQYPQHFTRFFKRHVGVSPREYRDGE